FATNDGGCWSSADGGITWTDHTTGMTIGQIYKCGQSQTVKDKVINGFQDNGSYAFTPTGWIAVGGGDGMECAIDYTNAALTYHTVYYGDIYRRVNNGSENHIAGENTNGITESGDWVTPFCLNEFNHKGMFIGYKNIWRTNNATTSPGVAWTKISDNLAGTNGTNMAVVEHSPANENLFYCVRGDNKLFRSDNCLDNTPLWYDLTSHLNGSGSISDVEANPFDENIVYITRNYQVFKSTDKGMTWTNLTENLPSIHISTIAFYKNAPEGLYVGTDAGVYYRDATTTGWVPFSLGLPVNARITELEIYCDNDSVSQDAIRASSYGRGLWGSDMYHAAPDADFTANKTTIPVSCSVDFTDLSTGVPTYFQWTFQGGTPATSNLKNPVNILYATAGTYQVTLKAWNEFGADSVTKTGFITVSSTLLPVADFKSDKVVLCSNETARFTDLSANCPSSWVWTFNPNTVTFMAGTTAQSQNPVVRFDAPGTYDVQMACYNFVGQGLATKLDYIVSGGYQLPFSESFASGFDTKQWTIQNPDLSITWDTISVAGTVAGSKAVWMNYFNYPLMNHRDQLISPAMDFSGYGSVMLNFRHAYEQRVRKDSLIVKISHDCGNNWERVWAMGPNGTPNVFVTHASTNNEFFPQSADEWCGGSYGVGCYSIDLTAWAGQKDIRLMFESYTSFGNNLFLNDIRVNGTVGLPENNRKEIAVTIHPNPSDGQFVLTVSNGPDLLSLQVVNPQGQVMHSGLLSLHSGSITKRLDFSGFPKGVYFIRLT
ncbi:MAG TPA: PKD domain-containing protein, partial [Bacteroidales bacterium]|nr:PKD domain-containing protein [Bacteroidales bacterium]